MYTQIFIIDIWIEVLHFVTAHVLCHTVKARELHLQPFTSKVFPLRNRNDTLLSFILYYNAPCKNYMIPWFAFFNAVSWSSHENVTTRRLFFFTVNISLLYLQMIKLFISDCAIKSNCSYCLPLYYISLSGSKILLPQVITFSSWPYYMICNMTGLNFMQWLVSCKMPQGAHCCATRGRWGRSLEGRGVWLRCGK